MLHIQSNVKSIGCNTIALHLKTLLPLNPLPNITQQQEHESTPSSRHECHVSCVLDIILKLCLYVWFNTFKCR